MNESDDDEATAASVAPIPALETGDESELARRAGAGDQQAFDLLYDRYFARTSWYFTIFARREARAAITEVMTELFGSFGTPSDLSLAERAYRLARAVELRRTPVADEPRPKKAKPAKVATAKRRAAKAPTAGLQP